MNERMLIKTKVNKIVKLKASLPTVYLLIPLIPLMSREIYPLFDNHRYTIAISLQKTCVYLSISVQICIDLCKYILNLWKELASLYIDCIIFDRNLASLSVEIKRKK